MNDYKLNKPLENYTPKELGELYSKLLTCLLEAGNEPRPYERQLLDMVKLQQNKNAFKKFTENMTEADFNRTMGFGSPFSDD